MATLTTVPLNKELLVSAAIVNAYAAYMTGYAEYLQSLPRHVDDVERDFGFDIYTKMLHDPAVGSAINTIKTAVFANGLRLTGRVSQPAAFRDDPQAQADFTRSEAIRQECEDMLDSLQQPVEEILCEMLDCLAYGYSVAEEVFAARNGKLWLTTLRVKPRTRYGFVVDAYMDVKGVVPIEFASGVMQDSDHLVVREKLFVLSFAPQGGDPRGKSLLRPAYNSWYLKMQSWPHYLKYLVQFATPSLVGILPPDASDVQTGTFEPDGSPVTISAAEAYQNALQAFQNGSVLVIDNGGDVKPLQVAGNGEAYREGIDFFDRQITRAILMTARATMEAQHASKADSDSSLDLLGGFTGFLRRMVETAFYRDVLYRVVKFNYGEAVAKQFAPVLTLADVAQEDLVEYGNMIASLQSAGFLHPSQYQGIDAKLNLPERDMEAQQEELAEQREAEADRTKEYRRLLNPREEGGSAS